MGFIRVKLIEVEPAEEWKTANGTFDPYCGVHIKEAVLTPGQGIQLVQKKKTIYPEWNKCFDTHLYDGRVISVVAMERPNKFLADVTIGVQFLVDQCKKSNGFSSIWVCTRRSLGISSRFFKRNKNCRFSVASSSNIYTY